MKLVANGKDRSLSCCKCRNDSGRLFINTLKAPPVIVSWKLNRKRVRTLPKSSRHRLIVVTTSNVKAVGAAPERSVPPEKFAPLLLLKDFAADGLGIPPIHNIALKQAKTPYRLRLSDRLRESAEFYAISAERKLHDEAVHAITEQEFTVPSTT